MKKKQKWGVWQILQGKMANGVPVRIMFQLPYDWHVTHNGEHTRKYWAKYRRDKKRKKK